jgi:hypothetical protein
VSLGLSLSLSLFLSLPLSLPPSLPLSLPSPFSLSPFSSYLLSSSRYEIVQGSDPFVTFVVEVFKIIFLFFLRQKNVIDFAPQFDNLR